MRDCYAARRYLGLASAIDEAVKGDEDISFSLEDLAFGVDDGGLGEGESIPRDEDYEAEDEAPAAANAASSPNDPPDLVAHDRKYHHGHYDGIGKCVYREKRAEIVAAFGEKADDLAYALTWINPEDVDGEEVDKADDLSSAKPQPATAEASAPAVEQKSDEKHRSYAAEVQRRSYARRSEVEKKLFNKRSVIYARIRRENERICPDKDKIKKLQDALEETKAALREYRINHGERVFGDNNTRDSILLGDKAAKMKQRRSAIRLEMSFCTKKYGMNMPPDVYAKIRKLRDEDEKVSVQLAETLNAERKKLDDDERRGTTTIRRYMQGGEWVEVFWSKGRWHTSSASPRHRFLEQQRARKAKILRASMTDEERSEFNRHLRELKEAKRRAQRIAEAGLERGYGDSLYDQYLDTLAAAGKKRFWVDGFKQFVSKKEAEREYAVQAASPKVDPTDPNLTREQRAAAFQSMLRKYMAQQGGYVGAASS